MKYSGLIREGCIGTLAALVLSISAEADAKRPTAHSPSFISHTNTSHTGTSYTGTAVNKHPSNCDCPRCRNRRPSRPSRNPHNDDGRDNSDNHSGNNSGNQGHSNGSEWQENGGDSDSSGSFGPLYAVRKERVKGAVRNVHAGLRNRVIEIMESKPGYTNFHISPVRRGCDIDKDPVNTGPKWITYSEIEQICGNADAPHLDNFRRAVQEANNKITEYDEAQSELYRKVIDGLMAEIEAGRYIFPMIQITNDEAVRAVRQYTTLSDWDSLFQKEVRAREDLRSAGIAAQYTPFLKSGGEERQRRVWKTLHSCADTEEEFMHIMDSLSYFHMEQH